MPIRLPSVDELLKAWKENPNALLIGMVFGFAAGYLVSWLVQINSVARAEFAKDRAEVSERKLEGEHGDLMAKLDASEKRFKVVSDEAAALKNKLTQIDASSASQEESTKKVLEGKDENYKSLLAKYEDQRTLNAELKRKYDELAVRAKETKALSERSAAKKEVDRLSAQVRDYKAEIDRLRRAPPTPALKSVIGASGGQTTVLLKFFEYNDCKYVDSIGEDVSMSPGLVEYHASRLTEEQLLEPDAYDHKYCITDKGRAYVVDKGLIGHSRDGGKGTSLEKAVGP
jgi:hypothetical protein